MAALNLTNSSSNLVLILDYGSQYTHLITRRIRSLSVLSLCISGTSPLSSITSLNPRVIILSGGPHSVHSTDDSPPTFPDGFLDYVRSNGIHVLGICYGLQLLVQKLGGAVKVGVAQEYGRMEISVERGGGLYESAGERQTVWMSHGDEVVHLPDGFHVTARSQQGAIASIESPERRLYGLQYHPEAIFFPFFFNV